VSVDHNFKYLLAKMAFEDPTKFLVTFATDDGSRYLRDLWNALQKRAHGEGFEPREDVGVELHGGVLVLRLPPVATPGSAVAVGASGGKEGLRVFALEVGDPDTSPGEHPLFLAELLPDGRTNYGPWLEGDSLDPDLASFAARVTELIQSAGR
jgi:hypothetical protein